MPISIPIQGVFDGSMEGQKITSLGAGTDSTDAVNKGQLDGKLDAAEKGAPNGVATLDAAGKVPAAQLPANSSGGGFALKASAPGAVNLNVTTEQAVTIPHGQAAAPAFQNIVILDVLQENPAINTAAVRWAAGYPIYDQAGSTATNARVLVRFSAGAGVAATGRARMFFAI